MTRCTALAPWTNVGSSRRFRKTISQRLSIVVVDAHGYGPWATGRERVTIELEQTFEPTSAASQRPRPPPRAAPTARDLHAMGFLSVK